MIGILLAVSACGSDGPPPELIPPDGFPWEDDTFNDQDVDVLFAPDTDGNTAMIITWHDEAIVVYQGRTVMPDAQMVIGIKWIKPDGSAEDIPFTAASPARLGGPLYALANDTCFDETTTTICAFVNEITDTIIEALENHPLLDFTARWLMDELEDSKFDLGDEADKPWNFFISKDGIFCGTNSFDDFSAAAAGRCLRKFTRRILGKPTAYPWSSNPVNPPVTYGFDEHEISVAPHVGDPVTELRSIYTMKPRAVISGPEGDQKVGTTAILHGRDSFDPAISASEKIGWFRWEFRKPGEDSGDPTRYGGQSSTVSLFLDRPGTYSFTLHVASRVTRLRDSSRFTITVEEDSGGDGTPACNDAANGVCTELAGSSRTDSVHIAAFRDSCTLSYSTNGCPSSMYTCTGGTGTIGGTSVEINAYWTAGFCDANPGVNIESTCTNTLGGSFSGGAGACQ